LVTQFTFTGKAFTVPGMKLPQYQITTATRTAKQVDYPHVHVFTTPPGPITSNIFTSPRGSRLIPHKMLSAPYPSTLTETFLNWIFRMMIRKAPSLP
jgi:hypothetical protein